MQLANKGLVAEAAKEVRRFHEKLCDTKILDPACGSGNFLYVALEHMKRLEGEAVDTLATLGETLYLEALESHTVDPHQLLGIEANPRAAAITELVPWIGYLQWHFRTRGKTMPAQPVLKNFRNIENRDAVLAWSREELLRDESGAAVTRWDGRTTRPHPTTGEQVPDETARVEVRRYFGAVPAAWPKADFIVGNPPFVAGKDLRAELGEGYAEALWAAYPDIPPAADYVMTWWHRAATEVAEGRARRFGFITTNSLPQTFGRRVVQHHLDAKKPISILFAIPDHPWGDGTGSANVRIAMTVGAPGKSTGRLCEVAAETTLPTGELATSTTHLIANEGLCSRGVQLMGGGFIVTPDEASSLGLGRLPGLEAHIRPYRNGRDLTARPRDVMVIDLFGLSEQQLRTRYPAVYQWVLERVKPEREQNNRASYRENWWIFGEPRRDLRPALEGLPRYVATVETAKHRVFQFLDSVVMPDNMLVVIATDDTFSLGTLSSRIHVGWALEKGGTLEDRPRYNKTQCFDPFPFPACDEAKKNTIRALAEELDALRKTRQAMYPELTLTGMYNVLEKIGAGAPLDAGEREIHDRGLISVVKRLHVELDAAVAAAYG